MDSMSIVLADDHTLFRAGLRALLDGVVGIEVVGEAGDGADALAQVERLRPDVLLSDLIMPGIDGFELTRRIAGGFPATRVLILTMYSNEVYAQQALRAGAAGYVLKASAPEELEAALRAVGRGERFLSPAISEPATPEENHQSSADTPPPTPLTPRQREILRMIAEGQTAKAIARRLGISTKTVESHRAQLMDRLEIHDIAGLVRYAIRIGLLDPDA